MSSDRPRVVFVYKQYGLGGNYIKLATKSLRSVGVPTTIEPRLSVWRILLHAKRAIYHIQFPEELYKAKWKEVSYLRALWTLLLFLLVIKRKGHLVWTFHDEVPHEPVLGVQADKAMRKLLARRCRIIFAHNKYAEQSVLRQLSPEANVMVVPHGNLRASFPPERIERQAARAKLGIPDDRFVYLFFGRMRSYKGVEDLISSFRRLNNANVMLVLAGVPAGSNWNFDETRRTLQEQIGGDERIITRFEWIPSDEVPALFAAADVAVFPFRHITTSGSVITALAFGKPVIVPRLGGIPELVDDNVGVLYDPQRADQLLQALCQAQRVDLGNLAANARALAESLSWNTYAEETLLAYQSLAYPHNRCR